VINFWAARGRGLTEPSITFASTDNASKSTRLEAGRFYRTLPAAAIGA
jgi:hypothetical protein